MTCTTNTDDTTWVHNDAAWVAAERAREREVAVRAAAEHYQREHDRATMRARLAAWVEADRDGAIEHLISVVPMGDRVEFVEPALAEGCTVTAWVASWPDDVIVDYLHRQADELSARQIFAPMTRAEKRGARQADRDVIAGCFSPGGPHRAYLTVSPSGAYFLDVDDRSQGRSVAWWVGYTRELPALLAAQRAEFLATASAPARCTKLSKAS